MVKYGNKLESSRKDGILANTDNIYDKRTGEMQEAINQRIASVSPADEEDLTKTTDEEGRSVTKFADRSYSPSNFSGKGYKILRKNIQKVSLAVTNISVNTAPSSDGFVSFIINGIETHVDLVASTDNTVDLVAQKIATKLSDTMTEYEVSQSASSVTLTRKFGGTVSISSYFSSNSTGVSCTISDTTKSEHRCLITSVMVNNPNTIYEIRYDFDLNGETIEIPEGCTLKFEGGSLKNGTLKGNNSVICSPIRPIFSSDITIIGNWNNNESYPEWFSAVGDGKSDDTKCLLNCVALGGSILLRNKAVYFTKNTIFTFGSQNIIGNNATIVSDFDNIEPTNYISQRCLNFKFAENFKVENLTIETDVCGIWFTGCKHFSIDNLILKCGKYAITLSGAKKNGQDYRCEYFSLNNIYINSKNSTHGDGIHINGGVSYGLISNVNGYTTDDFIALNSLEVETIDNSGDINISPSECNIYNIIFDNINISDVELGVRFYGWGYNDNQYIKNILFKNLNISTTNKYTNVEHQNIPCVRFVTTGGWSADNSNLKVLVNNIRFENCKFKTSDYYAPNVTIYKTYGDITFENCEFCNNYNVIRQDGNVSLLFNNCKMSVVSNYLWRKNNDTTEEDWTFINCKFTPGYYIDSTTCNIVSSLSLGTHKVNIINCTFDTSKKNFFESLKFNTGSIKKLELKVTNSEISNISIGNLPIYADIIGTSLEYVSILRNTSGKLSINNCSSKYLLAPQLANGAGCKDVKLMCDSLTASINDVDPSKYNIFLNSSLRKVVTNGDKFCYQISLIDSNIDSISSINTGALCFDTNKKTLNVWTGSYWKNLTTGFSGNMNNIGTTSERPILSDNYKGFIFYDSDLKKMILWNGTSWVNMDGTALN